MLMQYSKRDKHNSSKENLPPAAWALNGDAHSSIYTRITYIHMQHTDAPSAPTETVSYMSNKSYLVR